MRWPWRLSLTILALLPCLATGCVSIDHDAETGDWRYRSVLKDISGSFSVSIKKPDGTEVTAKVENLDSREKAVDLARAALDALKP